MSEFLKRYQKYILLCLALCLLCIAIVAVIDRSKPQEELQQTVATQATKNTTAATALHTVSTTVPSTSLPSADATTMPTTVTTVPTLQTTQPPTEEETTLPPTEAETTQPTTVPTEPSTEATTAPTEPKVTYREVDETVYALRQANIRALPGKENKKLGSLEWGESIRRVGIGSNGWSMVIYDGQVAYMYSSYLSTQKPTGYEVGASGLTEHQEAVLSVINAGKVATKLGYCQAWVADVYYKAGTGPRSSRCCATHAGAEWGVSEDWSTIQVGAAVYGYSSSVYGHVGIYIGNGMVAHNVGHLKIDTLEYWIEHYNGQCWGWNGGYNLTGKSTYNCKSYGSFMVGKH